LAASRVESSSSSEFSPLASRKVRPKDVERPHRHDAGWNQNVGGAERHQNVADVGRHQGSILQNSVSAQKSFHPNSYLSKAWFTRTAKTDQFFLLPSKKGKNS
jgi:hypothetical protein